jgi:hypothetical protein
MPIQIDYLKYHKSLARELRATKNRVRNLIGSNHWQTDGEHKEAVLRRILCSHLPESVQVGRGFVCYQDKTSTQIDILIISKNKPSLFKDGSLFIVTPDAVEAIIEVKTAQNVNGLKNTLEKLAENADRIRTFGNKHCCSGLFVYEDNENCDDSTVLRELFDCANSTERRAINWVTLGPRRFFRFWSRGEDVYSQCHGPTWHSYELEDGLAYAYFLSNVVWDTSRNNNLDMQFAWFPIEGGKERFRKYCISFTSPEPTPF